MTQPTSQGPAPLQQPATSANASSRARLDPRLTASLVTCLGTGAVFALVAAATYSLRTGLSVAVGAIIGAANLYALARIITSALAGPAAPNEEAAAPRPSRLWMPFAFLKVLFLYAGLWVLLSLHLVAPMALFVGLGSLPIGIAIGALVGDSSRG